MDYSIFYSWQKDAPNSTNRGFIEDCIEKAIKLVKVKEEDKLVIDSATRNTGSATDISNDLLDKINNAQIFVGDVTIINSHLDEFVSQHRDLKFRKTPNPNVLIETGYAAARLSWENIMLVNNTAYGKPEDLPFDIRGRTIKSFSLIDGQEKKTAKKLLVSQLKLFFEDCYKRINILEDDPSVKLYIYVNNKIASIHKEWLYFIESIYKAGSEERVFYGNKIKELKKEEFIEICKMINPLKPYYALFERNTPYPNWYIYLRYKCKRITDLIKEILIIHNRIEDSLLGLLVMLESLISTLAMINEVIPGNQDLEQWGEQIFTIKIRVDELYREFKNMYSLHIDEYHRQFRSKSI